MNLVWSRGGWFGGQLGGTAWMLVAAVLSLGQAPRAGLIVFSVFAAVNAAGLLMWRGRNRLSCYRATQILLLAIGIGSLATVYLLQSQGIWEAIQVGGVVSAEFAYGMIVVVIAAVLLLFRVRFGRAEG